MAASVPTTGPVSMADINAACKRGYNLNAYRGQRFWDYPNGVYKTMPAAPNPISFANFRGCGEFDDFPLNGSIQASVPAQLAAATGSIAVYAHSIGLQWNLSTVDYASGRVADFAHACGAPVTVGVTTAFANFANGAGYLIKPGMVFRITGQVDNFNAFGPYDFGVAEGLALDTCLFSGCPNICGAIDYSDPINMSGFGPPNATYFARVRAWVYSASGTQAGGLLRMAWWGGMNQNQGLIWNVARLNVTRIG